MSTESQLKLGIKKESEHQDTYDFLKKYVQETGELPEAKVFFTKIAQDHTKEISDYYTRLEIMEEEAG